jgi:hypothetical protein
MGVNDMQAAHVAVKIIIAIIGGFRGVSGNSNYLQLNMAACL